MRAKVAHLSTSEKFAASQTVIRNLAKDGLMEDGKEELLARKFRFQLLFSICWLSICLVGRLRASCDLISQYLPSVTRDALVNSYEYVDIYTSPCCD